MATKRKRRRSLGSSPTSHTAAAHRASDAIGTQAAILTNAARNKRCGKARIAYAEMYRQMGYLEAHANAGAAGATAPMAVFRQSIKEFAANCLTNELSGPKRRRRH